MSTHPKELKAEDGNNMARGDGLEWGPTALQQFSQVDVGQRSTKKREGLRNKGVLKPGYVWDDSADIGMGIIVASTPCWKSYAPHFDF